MIRSMTGFARSQSATPLGEALWELRSVNHRYLEVQVKIPEGFRSLEPDVRQAIARGIRRGKVDAAFSWRPLSGHTRAATLDMDYARELIGHAESVAAEIRQPGSINPVAIMGWPGVLQQPDATLESVFPAVLAGLEHTVHELAASRGREGARIHDMLEARCADVQTRVSALRARLPEVLTPIRDRLIERVRSLTATVDPSRIEQEIALIAQKMDVAEELDRLEAHVAEFRSTMSQPDPAGRRLDFLLQEFNREANTLASKSADAETTRQAVDIKVLIEQMREQVQNVE
jgi:uncharacterized protein (TIGR00255 family)